MKIHCLYRDFFLFLRMMNMERGKWSTFKKYYFDKHRDFLVDVWFNYQGYTLKNIRQRVEDIKKEDYADVEGELKLYDIEEHTREIILHCKSLLHDPDTCNIYLFIGFFSPDGFVLRHKDCYVICIGLERFHNFHNYQIMLSHEYCHYVLNKQNESKKESLQRLLVREGLSVYFSRIAYPGKKDNLYLFLGEDTFVSLNQRIDEIMKIIRMGEVKKEDLFGTQSQKFPLRSGYYIGYKMVTDFIDRTGISDVDFLMRKENQILIDF